MPEEIARETAAGSEQPPRGLASPEFFFLLQRIDRLDEKLSARIDHLEEKLDREVKALSGEIRALDEKLSGEISAERKSKLPDREFNALGGRCGNHPDCRICRGDRDAGDKVEIKQTCRGGRRKKTSASHFSQGQLSAPSPGFPMRGRRGMLSFR